LEFKKKKGAEVRRRGVKFSTSARGFVLVHTRGGSPKFTCPEKKVIDIGKKFGRSGFCFIFGPKPAIIRHKKNHLSRSQK